MILSQPIFTFLIVLGIVGGVGSLSTLVSLLIFEKERDYLVIEKKKNELEYLLKEAQISNLSSQIHPHFLFNSLNSISSLIRLNKNTDAVNSIQAISSLLRYTLRDSQQLVTVREELESVQMYLQIQKMRFGKRLDWKVNCLEDYLTVKIPMLSIQPLVENACKHGIEPKIEGGFINITIEMTELELSIHVENNGVGISENIILQFNRWKRDGIKPDTLGIGIINTYQRIQHFYDNQSDLVISCSSAGTLCSIIIRKENLYESIVSG